MKDKYWGYLEKIKIYSLLIIIGIVLIIVIYPAPFLLNYCFFMALLYINTFVHEIGHVLSGKLLSIDIRNVIIGNKKELFCVKLFGIPFIIKSGSGGLTIAKGTSPRLFKLRFWIFISGGILLQSLLVIICLFFFKIDSRYWQTINFPVDFALSNILLIVANLLPGKFLCNGTYIPNDGLHLIRIPFLTKVAVRNTLISLDLVEANELLFVKKDYRRAAEEYKKLMDKYPESEYICINYSVCLLKCLEFDKAKNVLSKLLLVSHDTKFDSNILNNLAWANFMTMDKHLLSEADLFSKKSLELSPDVKAFQSTRACILIELGHYNDGIRILQDNVDLRKKVDSQNHPINVLYMAFAYYKLGDTEKAYEYFECVKKNKKVFDPEDTYIYDIICNRIH